MPGTRNPKNVLRDRRFKAKRLKMRALLKEKQAEANQAPAAAKS